jgi:hypothetical protein
LSKSRSNATHFRVVDLDRRQHYRDRNPPWIKLHSERLEDIRFASLPDNAKAHLLLIELLASRMGNAVPYDERFVRARINARSRVDLSLLKDQGFIEIVASTPQAEREQTATPEERQSRGEGEDNGVCVQASRDAAFPAPVVQTSADAADQADELNGNGPGRPSNPIATRSRLEPKVKALAVEIGQRTGRTPRDVEVLAAEWMGTAPRVGDLTQDRLARTFLNLRSWVDQLNAGSAPDVEPAFVGERAQVEAEVKAHARPSARVVDLDADGGARLTLLQQQAAAIREAS